MVNTAFNIEIRRIIQLPSSEACQKMIDVAPFSLTKRWNQELWDGIVAPVPGAVS